MRTRLMEEHNDEHKSMSEFYPALIYTGFIFLTK